MMSDRLRRMLLVDALGAGLSAGLLGLVLPRLEGVIGMPTPTLQVLAAVALLFALHDVAAILRGPATMAGCLRRIMRANVLYCLATAVLLVVHRSRLTGWDVLYFGAEIALILLLVRTQARALKAADSCA